MKKQPSKNAQVLIVANVGNNADHATEVRHLVSISEPSVPTNRISTQKLRQLIDRIRLCSSEYIRNDTEFHCWLVDDESHEPVLFLSGLLAVREGRLTKAEAKSLNQQLLPQVTCRQKTTVFKLLASATGSSLGAAFDEDGEFEMYESPEEKEHDYCEEVFGLFDSYELVDVDHDINLYISAEFWQSFTMELPFSPTTSSSIAQLAYIVAKTKELLFQHANGELYELEIDDMEVWLLNDDDESELFISGLVDVRNGVLSVREMANSSKKSLSICPLATPSTCRAA